MAVVVTELGMRCYFARGNCIKNVAKIVLDGRKLRREISCLVILALDYMLLGKFFFHRKKWNLPKMCLGIQEGQLSYLIVVLNIEGQAWVKRE